MYLTGMEQYKHLFEQISVLYSNGSSLDKISRDLWPDGSMHRKKLTVIIDHIAGLGLVKKKESKIGKKLDYDVIKNMIEVEKLSMSEVARRISKPVAHISMFCKRKNIICNFELTAKKEINIDELVDKYNNGMSMFNLVKEYGLCSDSLKSRVWEVYPGFHFRTMDEVKRPPELNDKEKLRELLITKSPSKISKELDIKRQTVISNIKKLGLQEYLSTWEIKKHRLSKEELIDLYVNRGYTGQYIAGKYFLSIATVFKMLSKHGIESRPSKVVSDSKHALLNNKDELIELYINQGRTMSYLACVVGTSLGNISHHLKKHGIPKRTKKEVYKALSFTGSKKVECDSKFGMMRFDSQLEKKFFDSIADSATSIIREPEMLEHKGMLYKPDFKVDGELVEVKPKSRARKYGYNRSRFMKQFMIAKKNNKLLKVWDNGFYNIDPIHDDDMYYAENFRLFFDNQDELFEFLHGYGFKHPQYQHEDLLVAVRNIDVTPGNELNANYSNHMIMNFIKHFNEHFYFSTHKGYNCVASAFDNFNSNVLRHAVGVLWDTKKDINIFNLLSVISKSCKDFATPSIFKPWIAKHVYNKYLPNGGRIFDPCMGWGGRLIGTIDGDYEYFGNDLNINSVKSNTSIGEFLGGMLSHIPIITNCDASNMVFPDADLLLTSPPYDDTEFYYGLENQCKNSSGIYDNILGNFNGVVALNVPKRHGEFVLECGRKHGRVLLETLEMKTANFIRRDKTFEPIFVFSHR